MKMGILSSAVFWGAILILIGLSLILKYTFGINIPVFRIGIGLLFVWLGLKIILGGSFRFSREKDNMLLFSQGKLNYDPKYSEYNVIFSSGKVDLQNIPVTGDRVKVNVVFGSADVRIDENIPARFEMSTAFGSADAPDQSTTAFGKYIYHTKAYRPDASFVTVEANVVFGSLSILCK